MKKVLFTTILGGYDTLKEPKIINSSWEYICITDRDIKSDVFKIIKTHDIGMEDKYLSRYNWICPHKYFDYDICVMIGGQSQVNCNLNEFVDNYLNDSDMALMKHYSRRSTIREEAAAIIRLNKADRNVVLSTLKKFYRDGYKDDRGLYAHGVIIRKNSEKMRLFCDMWWSEVRDNCHRDQLILPYVLWKYDFIKINAIQDNLYKKGLFIKHNHL